MVRDAEIGLVLYPGVQMAAVLGMTDLFQSAMELGRKKGRAGPVLTVSHWRLEDGKPVRVDAQAGSGDGSRPCVLVLPPALGDPIRREEAAPFAAWLRECHAGGIQLASICAGAFLLGETGLLAGRTITTNWVIAETFERRFPDVTVDTDRLLADDGDIVTAGGVMAWVDLGLKLIDRFLGPTVMLEIARQFVIDPPGREQRYYSTFSPRLLHGDGAILKVQHFLQASEAREIGLDLLAAQAGLEERTFLRRFRRATGLTTTDYCQRLRVAKAQEHLQFTTRSVDRVALDVGYNDPGAFRKVFARIVGLTPGEYRKRFRS
ncbi:AraC family transcriptional regulator [Shinella sp. SUS2]|jgi:transcriptional regulator GlxA family with amidase domain|uniref:GlxA family transcriptional regulator n=1 Tax=unclassified Shinella TaxID=2643062 RepID=UPI000681AA66|nr:MULTISPECIES: GlxA family transcriptional regulator [unclassified Shinella]KNY16841.1 AraC family transcriptional regulator [Shinella sp. SUS2]KOC73319.1 AraC family transcriptional regulator [Shinella sp. GWS1]